MTASVKQPLASKKRKLSSKQQQQHNTALGSRGETLAQNFLLQKKYRILHTNILLGRFEVDIVAYDPLEDELVFCEIKTRSSSQFGLATAAVNYQKINKIRQAIGIYLSLYPSTKNVRIDTIAVLKGNVTHYKNITLE